jgi:hypothetical protein
MRQTGQHCRGQETKVNSLDSFHGGATRPVGPEASTSVLLGANREPQCAVPSNSPGFSRPVAAPVGALALTAILTDRKRLLQGVVDLKDYFSDQAINLFHSVAIYLQTTSWQLENSRAENHSQWFMGIEFWE